MKIMIKEEVILYMVNILQMKILIFRIKNFLLQWQLMEKIKMEVNFLFLLKITLNSTVNLLFLEKSLILIGMLSILLNNNLPPGQILK